MQRNQIDQTKVADALKIVFSTIQANGNAGARTGPFTEESAAEAKRVSGNVARAVVTTLSGDQELAERTVRDVFANEETSRLIDTVTSLAVAQSEKESAQKNEEEHGNEARNEFNAMLDGLTSRFTSDPRGFLSNVDSELTELKERMLETVRAEHAEYVTRFIDWLRSTTFIGILRTIIAILQHVKRYVNKRDHTMFNVIQEFLTVPEEVFSLRQAFEAALQEGSQEYEAFWTIMKFITQQSDAFARIEDEMFESISEEVLNILPVLMQAGEGGFSGLPDELRMMF